MLTPLLLINHYAPFIFSQSLGVFDKRREIMIIFETHLKLRYPQSHDSHTHKSPLKDKKTSSLVIGGTKLTVPIVLYPMSEILIPCR